MGLIYTPNGSDAGNINKTDGLYYTIVYTSDLPEEVKLDLKENVENDYPNLIDGEYGTECTYGFNCHSYAWHNQNISNNSVWLSYPNVYYSSNDNSYVEVDEPRIGDIICYFDSDKIEEYQNIHSGIVVGFSGEDSNNICGSANTVIVRSKWGALPVFEHKGDYCPYTSNYGGEADYVKFYRPRTNMEIDLNANMSSITSSISLSNTGEITDRYYMYELNVEASGMYDIWVNPDISLNERFYDENMNLLSYSAYYPNTTNAHHYYINLAQGRYYFRVENVNASESADVSITFASHDPHNYQYINVSDDNHTASCPCGHTAISNHTYEYKPLNDTYHILMCDCGKTSGTQSLHTLKFESGFGNYKQCTGCGILVNTGGTGIYPIQPYKNPLIEECFLH